MNQTSPQRPPQAYFNQADSDNVCFLCGNPRYSLRQQIEHFGYTIDFRQCACGLIKQTPMPNEDFFEWFFNSGVFFSAKESKEKNIWGFYDYFRDEDCRLATSQRRYRALREFFSAGRPLDIMKIGPSTGSFLYVANEHGHNAIGCDVSERFVGYGKEHYGVRIDKGRFEDLPYEDEAFDRIMLFNVIENVPNLGELLTSINRRLRPGGYFIFNHVPMSGNLVEKLQSGRYFMYRPPMCYMFADDAAEQLLEKFGFAAVAQKRDIRIMHLEKILTLLGWIAPLGVAQALKVDRVKFPIYAYPSKITVAQKISDDTRFFTAST